MNDSSSEERGGYSLKSINTPELSGALLKGFIRLLESPLGGRLASIVLSQAGVTAFRQLPVDTPPTFIPRAPGGDFHAESSALGLEEVPETKPVTPGFQFSTIHDYAAAYRNGKAVPEEVARSVLGDIEQSDAGARPLRAFIASYEDEVMAMAEASTKRLREGRPRSILEGVPVAVKDEIDMVPYPTTAGTAFLNSAIASEDAAVVERLREAGALLLGKTNMHELGVGVTGHNSHYGTPRNPYDSGHHTGGSSSGSAAAVAAGLCPVALGADAGGSIRIPASFCGVTGLKPTFGRISTAGTADLTWSVRHMGPLAGSATDAAIVYNILAGPDPNDPQSLYQPVNAGDPWHPAELDDWTIGIYEPWFRHADAEVVRTCERMVTEYEEAGADIRSVTIPDLEECRAAHLIILGSELFAAWEGQYAEHRTEFGLDVRSSLALMKEYTAVDYIRAQTYRTRLIRSFDRAFQEVDVVLTPGTGMVAPEIPEAHLPEGTSDFGALAEIMRFAFPSNLTGYPAISYPVGYTDDNLPVGLQAMAGPWEEEKLLRLARFTERLVERRAPEVVFDPLGGV